MKEAVLPFSYDIFEGTDMWENRVRMDEERSISSGALQEEGDWLSNRLPLLKGLVYAMR